MTHGRGCGLFFMKGSETLGVKLKRASNIKTLDVKYVPMIIIYKEEKTMKLLKD